jgi:hypothetical protein
MASAMCLGSTPPGGVGRIEIGGRHLVLFMHGLFHRVLHFHFFEELAHGVMNLGRFRQLLPGNAAFFRRVGLHKTAIDR